MLTLRCAGCRSKLFKYAKLGQGEVHRCHKSRMEKPAGVRQEEDRLLCRGCGATLGLDKGSHYSMNKGSFTYKGTKVNKL
jgi:hypothetical protein